MVVVVVVCEEMGEFMHAAKEDAVIRSTNQKIPKFNAFIYLQNKQPIGKIDEVFGPINQVVRTQNPSIHKKKKKKRH